MPRSSGPAACGRTWIRASCPRLARPLVGSGSMSEKEALDALQMMVRERDWEQFHSLENLAKSVAIEAGELLECFQWANAAPNDRIIDELADVLTYCYLLAAKLGVEPSEAVINKLDLTRSKYPVDEARGTSAKYTEL